MFNRDIEDKLPRFPTKSQGKHHENARKSDDAAKKENKRRYDIKNRTILTEINVGDWAYRRETAQTTLRGPWEAIPFQIIRVVHNQITGTRHGQVSTRDRSDWKLLVKRPAHLNPFTGPEQTGTPSVPRETTEHGERDDPDQGQDWEVWEENVTRPRTRAQARWTPPPPPPASPTPPPPPQTPPQRDREKEHPPTPPPGPSRTRSPPPQPAPGSDRRDRHVCQNCKFLLKTMDGERTCACEAKRLHLVLQQTPEQELLELVDREDVPQATIGYVRGGHGHPDGDNPHVKDIVDAVEATRTVTSPPTSSSDDDVSTPSYTPYPTPNITPIPTPTISPEHIGDEPAKPAAQPPPEPGPKRRSTTRDDTLDSPAPTKPQDDQEPPQDETTPRKTRQGTQLGQAGPSKRGRRKREGPRR